MTDGVRFFAVVERDTLSGYVLDYYPEEKVACQRECGADIIGDFATFEEALAAVRAVIVQQGKARMNDNRPGIVKTRSTRYTLYLPDGSVTEYRVMLAEVPDIEALKTVLQPHIGEPIEHVTVLKPGSENAPERADMFVNEFSAVPRGLRREPMQRNERATELYRAATLLHAPDTDPESMPAIYGPAVLFERIVWR
jgi:hypothetical protein